MTESRLTALSDELYEGIASFLRYKDHVRASMTCRQLQDAYWSIQRRLTVLKAKNVTSRRRRTGYFNQLKACSSHLRVLHLVNFSSSSAIFNQIESLTGLRELDLSGNGIAGRLPSCISNFKQLEVLALANNNFTGNLPCLAGMTKLRIIRMSFNKFEGPIPNSWSTLTSLEMISMSYNRLEGPIPDFFSNLCHLHSLLLGSNKLSGPIPASLGKLQALRELFLFENCLEGEVPEEIFTGCRKLQKVFLSGNQLSGNVPGSVGSLAGLKELILSSNDGLSGGLPESLGYLAGLRTLDLSGTQITTDQRMLGQLRGKHCEVIY